MFPNVRLLAGAFVASIVALSCGFGLFAEFRVNHEPLSRLPVGTAPVRFVANEAVAPRAGWGTPFDGQSRLNGPQRGDIAAGAPAPTVTGQVKLEAASANTVEPIKPIALATPAIEPVRPREIAQPAEAIEPVVTVTPAAATIEKPPAAEVDRKISRSASAAGDVTEQAKPSAATLAAGPADGAASPASVVPNKTASIPSSPADGASPLASTASPSDADSTQPTGTIAPAAAAAPQPGSDAALPKQNSAPAEAAETPDQNSAPSPIIAAATSADEPAIVVPSAKEGALSPAKASDPAKAAAKQVRKIGAKRDSKIARKPLARRRLAIRRRGVRRVRRSTGRDGLSDPVFQSAPNFSGATASRSGYNSANW